MTRREAIPAEEKYSTPGEIYADKGYVMERTEVYDPTKPERTKMPDGSVILRVGPLAYLRNERTKSQAEGVMRYDPKRVFVEVVHIGNDSELAKKTRQSMQEEGLTVLNSATDRVIGYKLRK